MADVDIYKDGTTGYKWLLASVTTDVDPTTNTVHMALTTTGQTPIAADWVAGGWEGAATLLDNGKYQAVARAKAGEGQSLDKGTDDLYVCWLKITTAAEVIIKNLGTVKVEGN